MCGIAGIISLDNSPLRQLLPKLSVMNQLQIHRGPDGVGSWEDKSKCAGFGHRRLAIIDTVTGQQPMTAGNLTITYNGEIYNYLELKEELRSGFEFKTTSDTEVILAAYQKWGADCVKHFRGMFAFAIFDSATRKFFGARDQFGIKPFYYTVQGNELFFASEVKALLPFIAKLEVDDVSLRDYLTFQTYIDYRTPYKDIFELKAGETITLQDKKVKLNSYWEIYYKHDWSHDERYFEDRLRALLDESVKLHLRSDVPLGAYVSGGIDSSAVAALAKKNGANGLCAFVGKFSREGELYDESKFAKLVAQKHGIEIFERDITSKDFLSSIEKVVYHLDYPVAGPGSFPQFCISELASKHRKVVLGGQGGDEIFGGYTRYLLAYFEQCIKGAIDGTLKNGNFVVTYESIIPNLTALGNYKPLLQDFFSKGMFEPMDRRYFHLINRATDLGDEVNWSEFSSHDPFVSFEKIFNAKNVGSGAYFDKMTHFDFKTLLPSLLQVEDRMSMAHGLESRVPLVETKLIEFAATIPADKKFKDGTLKRLLTNVVKDYLPKEVIERKNKMGFPVPFNLWVKDDLKDFIHDVFSSDAAKGRRYISNQKVLGQLQNQSQFGRKLWGFLNLELWQREFFDKHHKYRAMYRE